MKFILAQPANLKFQWELDVVLTNIRSLSKDIPIVLLFLSENPDVIEHISSRYDGLEIHSYPDHREQKNYIPTIRPYLIWRYLDEFPEAQKEDYFQIDSDVIFRELPDFSKMPLDGKIAWASDCDGYIGYNYLITRQKGLEIVEGFSRILNIPVETIKQLPGGGAQWIMSKPSAGLWYHIYKDSQLLYDFIHPIETDLQKWTAEMWAQLYNLVKFGWEVKLHSELDFIRPTDPIEQWQGVKILHNAGVTGPLARTMFYKGKYLTETPFGENFKYIDPKMASSVYVQAIEKVIP